MQFEISAPHPDADTLIAALRPLDPALRIALDAAHGRLEVIGEVTTARVLTVLETMGHVARPLQHDVHVSGGSTCCGHCS